MIRRLISGVLLIWIIGFLAFILTLPKPAGDEKTEGVIVLTGTQERIQRGVEVLAKHQAERLLISGVKSDVKLRGLAVTYHVPNSLISCCIDLGRKASDTRSNAAEAADWLNATGYHSVRIVTDNWHMRRAELEVRHDVPANIHLVFDAVETPPTMGILFIEYHKYIWRRSTLLLGVDM